MSRTRPETDRIGNVDIRLFSREWKTHIRAHQYLGTRQLAAYDHPRPREGDAPSQICFFGNRDQRRRPLRDNLRRHKRPAPQMPPVGRSASNHSHVFGPAWYRDSPLSMSAMPTQFWQIQLGPFPQVQMTASRIFSQILAQRELVRGSAGRSRILPSCCLRYPKKKKKFFSPGGEEFLDARHEFQSIGVLNLQNRYTATYKPTNTQNLCHCHHLIAFDEGYYSVPAAARASLKCESEL